MNNIKMMDWIDRFKELILVLPLSISIFRIFFSERRASVFDVATLITLLIWRFVIRDKPLHPLPKTLIVTVCLLMLSDFAGALMSDNQLWELAELRKYVHVFIGALLFTLPLEDRTRGLLIILFLAAAAFAGLDGIQQYIRLTTRSRGALPHAILYAETLSLACGSTLLMFFFGKSRKGVLNLENIFLAIVLLLTLGGILFSGARGVWIAFISAGTIALFLNNHKRAIVILLCTVVVLSCIFYKVGNLRERAESIITSFYTDNEAGSTSTRMELWKGAFIIFQDHPLLGTGSGNFEPNIKKLVKENKIRETPTMVHAHNIYFQALATRGIVGLVILAVFLATLLAWGRDEIKLHEGIGGYLIIFCTILTMIGGLVEDNLGTTKYLAAFCFTMGLLGPLGNHRKTGTDAS